MVSPSELHSNVQFASSSSLSRNYCKTFKSAQLLGRSKQQSIQSTNINCIETPVGRDVEPTQLKSHQDGLHPRQWYLMCSKCVIQHSVVFYAMPDEISSDQQYQSTKNIIQYVKRRGVTLCTFVYKEFSQFVN